MKTVSTNTSSQSRAQCRPDDTSGARFVSVQREASGAHTSTDFRHKRGNILRRAIAALFSFVRLHCEIRRLRRRVHFMQIRYDNLCAFLEKPRKDDIQ